MLGYYPVLSWNSTIPSVLSVAEALARDTISPPKPSKISAYAHTLSLRDTLIGNSLTFRDASRSDLHSAVVDANAKLSVSNFIFVDPMILDTEAAFTPTPLIWGLSKNLDDSQDPVLNDRIEYCENLLQKHGIDRFTCLRASLGHPNVQGAQRYAQRLFEALSAS